MSYSKRYRERTIEYRQAGHSLEATHQVFKVSKSTIQKWEKQLKETGNLEKKDLHRSFRRDYPKVCVNLQTEFFYLTSVWRFTQTLG
ncbi:hypothetical protein D7Y09_08345 [bacterium 1XD42-1]|nr:hypothetical protein D7X25_32795 [bacterium 1XD42-8]RKJ64566.1 hypothetical protein D7Y09_08345 [bacterium 1XD42-1]